MVSDTRINYFGWSTLSIEAPNGVIFFDPFYRKYCGANWFNRPDLGDPDVVCITHGHEEHFQDCPEVIKKSGAKVVATKAICSYLKWINKVPQNLLRPISFHEPMDIDGFRITTFPWQHRDINVYAAVLKGLLKFNLAMPHWAWSSLVSAPFYSAFAGFHVELPSGLKILNYNEGFNSKMTDAEIIALGKQFETDVLLAGMQMHYVHDVARGAAALKPKIVLLYPPHEEFHNMMGATMSPWEDFAEAVQNQLPNSIVVIAKPGTSIDAVTGEVLEPLASSVEAA
jgi:L-ascorbate metabolism protein UlaG (beta-lactamase superfamily)